MLPGHRISVDRTITPTPSLYPLLRSKRTIVSASPSGIATPSAYLHRHSEAAAAEEDRMEDDALALPGGSERGGARYLERAVRARGAVFSPFGSPSRAWMDVGGGGCFGRSMVKMHPLPGRSTM